MKYRERIIKLEEKVKLYEKGIHRKGNNSVAVTPDPAVLDLVAETESMFRVIAKTQMQYEEEKAKRKRLVAKYLNL